MLENSIDKKRGTGGKKIGLCGSNGSVPSLWMKKIASIVLR
jgi:hypothetical protein